MLDLSTVQKLPSTSGHIKNSVTSRVLHQHTVNRKEVIQHEAHNISFFILYTEIITTRTNWQTISVCRTAVSLFFCQMGLKILLSPINTRLCPFLKPAICQTSKTQRCRRATQVLLQQSISILYRLASGLLTIL